jgi:hypothetical protein
MIGTSCAFSIERGDIPAMQDSAEHGPRPTLNGILFNQLLVIIKKPYGKIKIEHIKQRHSDLSPDGRRVL